MERTPRHLRKTVNATEAKTVARLQAAEAVGAFLRSAWESTTKGAAMTARTFYRVDDLQAVEPAELPQVDGITLVLDDELDSMGFDRVSVIGETRESVIDYIRANWGSDDGGWFREWIVERIYEETESEWVVTYTPDDPSIDPAWVGMARDALHAFDKFADEAGFVPYSTLIFPNHQLSDEEQSGWLGTDSEGRPWAIFTNTTVYALPTGN